MAESDKLPMKLDGYSDNHLFFEFDNHGLNVYSNIPNGDDKEMYDIRGKCIIYNDFNIFRDKFNDKNKNYTFYCGYQYSIDNTFKPLKSGELVMIKNTQINNKEMLRKKHIKWENHQKRRKIKKYKKNLKRTIEQTKVEQIKLGNKHDKQLANKFNTVNDGIHNSDDSDEDSDIQIIEQSKLHNIYL